ncbi:MAG: tetratricopeptide repeat protein [Prevotellaceae bacterium]|jgi:tetratricopeptide (TPR) repeat protein|nr:tetratricopeptide repeat protein [Prevotellaceae bacterium]
MSKKVSHGDENLEAIEHTLSNAESFIQKYQKPLTYGFGAALLLVAAFFAYQNWYKAPLEEEAQAQMFAAVQYFEQDSLSLALNGDGSNLGLLDVASQYGSTKAGNLANFYAGLCYLHTGVYDEALTFLKKYSPADNLSRALSCGNMGDAYSELKDYSNAASYYKKAANADDNRLTSPRYLMKAGLVLEAEAKFAEAAKLYEQVKKDFPETNEGREAEKYLARAQMLAEQK